MRSWREANGGKSLADLAAELNELIDKTGSERRIDAAQLSRVERGFGQPSLTVAACIETLCGIPAASWVATAA